MKSWVVITLVSGSLLLAAPASAAVEVESSQSDRVDAWMAKHHLHPAFDKLGRGLGNTLGGWLEVPLQIQRRYTSKDPVTTFFTGSAVGLVKGAARTAVGVYETVTFFIPYPEQYAPILPPLEYYHRDNTRYRGVL